MAWRTQHSCRASFGLRLPHAKLFAEFTSNIHRQRAYDAFFKKENQEKIIGTLVNLIPLLCRHY